VRVAILVLLGSQMRVHLAQQDRMCHTLLPVNPHNALDVSPESTLHLLHIATVSIVLLGSTSLHFLQHRVSLALLDNGANKEIRRALYGACASLCTFSDLYFA
jgi:hypothetical protein